MTDIKFTNTLRLLQSADHIKARLTGEFSSIHGLSVNEFFLMMHLERADRHRLSRTELAKRMHLNASTVTRMAMPMEKLGFFTRQADERDARLAFVVLTDTGLERLQEARATFAKKAGQIFADRWNDEDLENLSKLLHRLVADSDGSLT